MRDSTSISSIPNWVINPELSTIGITLKPPNQASILSVTIASLILVRSLLVSALIVCSTPQYF